MPTHEPTVAARRAANPAPAPDEAPQLDGIRPARVWRHSSYSEGADQTCVDVAITAVLVAVRDSKNPTGPILRFTTREWHVFLLGVRAGEFDLPSSSQLAGT